MEGLSCEASANCFKVPESFSEEAAAVGCIHTS